MPVRGERFRPAHPNRRTGAPWTHRAAASRRAAFWAGHFPTCRAEWRGWTPPKRRRSLWSGGFFSSWGKIMGCPTMPPWRDFTPGWRRLAPTFFAPGFARHGRRGCRSSPRLWPVTTGLCMPVPHRNDAAETGVWVLSRDGDGSCDAPPQPRRRHAPARKAALTWCEHGLAGKAWLKRLDVPPARRQLSGSPFPRCCVFRSARHRHGALPG